MRQKPPQRLGLASAIRSAWEFASLRQIWERAVDFVATKLGASKPAQVGPRRHPAEIASNISGLPAEHRACAIELYDAIDRYVPDDEYTGETVLYEATAEPDRGSERVAKKWAKISTNLTIVPVEGTHMSMVKPPRGVPLARDLCRRLGEIGSLASQGRDQSRPLKIAAHR
jgi:hypothetical protein